MSDRFQGFSVIQSLLLHGLVLALLVFSFGNPTKIVSPEPEPEIIQAVVMDETKIQTEVDRLRDQEQQKRQLEESRQQELEDRRQLEEKKLANLQKKSLEEQQKARQESERLQAAKEKEGQKLKELQQKQQEEARRLVEIKKQQEETERQRLAEEKKRLEAERKRLEEEKRLAALEQKKKDEAERLKHEKLKRQLREKELALRKQREAKRKAEAAAQSQQAIANALVLIKQKVERSWIRPLSVAQDLSCKIRVKLIPGGEVIDANVVQTSGNPAFDRSAEAAVLKASPIPVPTNPQLFATFRTFNFDFKPQ